MAARPRSVAIRLSCDTIPKRAEAKCCNCHRVHGRGPRIFFNRSQFAPHTLGRPLANRFVIGTAVINTHSRCMCVCVSTQGTLSGKILFRNGNLTLALAGWWWLLWAGSGCGRAPGWCGWAVVSLLRRCCGGAVCWQQAISLPAQSVVVGEVGQCVGVRWRAGCGVGVLRTGPVAAGVRIYSIVSHL